MTYKLDFGNWFSKYTFYDNHLLLPVFCHILLLLLWTDNILCLTCGSH